MAATNFKLLLRELRTSVRISRNSLNLPASAGSCLVARRWYQGKPTDFQPGHWLLCLMGANFILAMLYSAAEFAMEGLRFQALSENTQSLLMTLALQMAIIVAMLALGIILPVRRPWRWWLVFVVVGGSLSALYTVGAILHLYRLLTWCSLLTIANRILEIGLLIGLTLWDGVTKPGQRNEIHWLGIFATFLLITPWLVIHILGW